MNKLRHLTLNLIGKVMLVFLKVHGKSMLIKLYDVFLQLSFCHFFFRLHVIYALFIEWLNELAVEYNFY